MLNRSTKYFPLIGWMVGAIVGGVYWGGSQIFSVEIALIFSMAAGIIITGAFHEDGFADVCDGFGGGYTKEARLNIMKDSRIGTYGSVGLVLIFLLKFLILKELSSVCNLVIVLIVAHAVSRVIPVIVIAFGEYARDDLTSKVKPIGRKISLMGFIQALLLGLSSILLLNNYWFFGVVILPLVSGLFMMRYFQKRIDGYTGDCLGAIQQVSEIAVYLSIYLIIIWL
jgi:adenosylcobinamide-GDP ribazoletransferase